MSGFCSRHQGYEYDCEICNAIPRPCPFCGGEGATHVWEGGWLALCDNDDCNLKPETYEQETEQEAIKIWNNRVND